MIEAPERPKTQTGGAQPPRQPPRPPTTGLVEPDPERRPSRYHVRMAHKVIASVFVIVVALILGGAVHPALYLLALIALIFWL